MNKHLPHLTEYEVLIVCDARECSLARPVGAYTNFIRIDLGKHIGRHVG